MHILVRRTVIELWDLLTLLEQRNKRKCRRLKGRRVTKWVQWEQRAPYLVEEVDVSKDVGRKR